MPTGFSWSELGVDAARLLGCNAVDLPAKKREFVLYWCMTSHRAEQNHGLDAAVALGNRLNLPVVCYQALRPDYPYASDRIHAFVIQGLSELSRALKQRRIAHWVELPRNPKEHVKRIAQLGRRAAAVLSDHMPTFVVPHHLHGAARALKIPLWAVDSACVVPMQRIPERQVGAYALRPKLRKLWPEYLHRRFPDRAPRHSSLQLEPGFEVERNPSALATRLDEFEIDHSVQPVALRLGGRSAALAALKAFVKSGLEHYEESRNDPSVGTQSWLSPYLHFGAIFAGEAADHAVEALGEKHPGAQGFLEELLVRRELGFNYCLYTAPERQLSFASLPRWAQDTLNAHRHDARTPEYQLAQLEEAQTDDELWNAAQRQLRSEGRIHGYLRMLWGKRILTWSKTPEQALATVAELNDRYALDGRDPASVSNFMWLLGLHDRPFQERPIYGKVRPMSSQRTAEKFDVSGYLARYKAAHGHAKAVSTSHAEPGRSPYPDGKASRALGEEIRREAELGGRRRVGGRQGDGRQSPGHARRGGPQRQR